MFRETLVIAVLISFPQISSAQEMNGQSHSSQPAVPTPSDIQPQKRRSRSDLEVAAQASWQQSLDSGKLNEFVEFIESRLAVKAPKWWKKIAQTGKKGNVGQAIFHRGDYWPYGKDSSPYRWPTATLTSSTSMKITTTNRGRLLELDGVSIPVDVVFEESKKLHGRSDILVAARARDAVLVAIVPIWGVPYSLWKFDGKSGKVAWSSTIQAASLDPNPSGMGWHFVDVVPDPKGNLFVFGALTQTLYVEKLSADGKTMFRFRSNL